MEIKKVNLKDTFTKFSDYWNPRIIGELNGQQVKLAKFSGEFIWHTHDNEDGPISDATLNWTSDLHGALGSGDFLGRA